MNFNYLYDYLTILLRLKEDTNLKVTSLKRKED